MRKLLRIGALALGVVGALVCVTAVGIGWWAAIRTTSRLDRVAARLDRGLSEVDVQLARVESRVNAVRTDLNAARGAAETIAAENPDLPRVRAEIELLLERLVATFDRADALAESLRSAAMVFRTATDIIDQFSDEPETTVRARSAIDKIDLAAESLNGLRARVEALKSARAVQLTGELVALAREAKAGAELLAEGARRRPPGNRRRPRADGPVATPGRLLGLHRRDRQHGRLVMGRPGSTVPHRLRVPAVGGSGQPRLMRIASVSDR